MRFIFKTSYLQDIRLARHGGHVFWYGLLCLALLAAPWGLPEYWLAQLTFVLIYGIAGLGLMLLSGYTGQFSLGHAAFLGVGAYTQALLTAAGWPFFWRWPARRCWPRPWASSSGCRRCASRAFISRSRRWRSASSSRKSSHAGSR